MKNAAAFHAPLHPLDSETQTSDAVTGIPIPAQKIGCPKSAPWYAPTRFVMPRHTSAPGKQNDTLNEQSALIKNQKLFLHTQDRVLGSFGDAEFHHALGLDLDRFTSGGIAADPSFAVDQNQLAETRNCEGVFGVFVSQVRDVFQDLDCLLFGDAVLVSEFSCDL